MLNRRLRRKLWPAYSSHRAANILEMKVRFAGLYNSKRRRVGLVAVIQYAKHRCPLRADSEIRSGAARPHPSATRRKKRVADGWGGIFAASPCADHCGSGGCAVRPDRRETPWGAGAWRTAPASRRGFGGGVRNDAPPGAGVARGVRNDDLAVLRAGVPAAQAPPEGGVPGQRPGRTAGRTQAPQVPECGLFSE